MDRKSLVYKGSPPDHCCCDTALRILPDGEFVAIFMTGGSNEPDPQNHIRISRSSDRGDAWSAADVVLRFDDKACLLSEAYVHDGAIVVFVSTHDGRFENWLCSTIESADGGRTWSDPVPFDPLPRRTFVRNRYIASWGEWILPFQSYDTVSDPAVSPLVDGSNKRAVNGALFSDDEGRTWGASNLIGPTAGWAENNVVELAGENLAMLIRAGKTGRLYRSDSADRGRTWTDPKPTDIPNPGSKFRLFRLDDGRIALVHNPNGEVKHPNSAAGANCARNPLALWVSDDDMTTWGYKRVLTDFPGMLAYPDGVVDDGFVHFVFDYNRHDVIYWAAELPPE